MNSYKTRRLLKPHAFWEENAHNVENRKFVYNCSGTRKHEKWLSFQIDIIFKIFNVTRAKSRDLTREFLSKLIVLGLISNEISWAEHEDFTIYSPPPSQYITCLKTSRWQGLQTQLFLENTKCIHNIPHLYFVHFHKVCKLEH